MIADIMIFIWICIVESFILYKAFTDKSWFPAKGEKYKVLNWSMYLGKYVVYILWILNLAYHKYGVEESYWPAVLNICIAWIAGFLLVIIIKALYKLIQDIDKWKRK